jgi:hypothetical protein
MQVGAMLRLSLQLQLIAACHNSLIPVVPMYCPPPTLLALYRVHFMTNKVGNVVDKVRSLRNICACSLAAIFRPVSIIYRNV